jgi:hypothetical protein
MRVTNDLAAHDFLTREYRAGYSLEPTCGPSRQLEFRPKEID